MTDYTLTNSRMIHARRRLATHSRDRPNPRGLSFEEVAYVAGMETPGEAMRNAVKWLVKHGYSDADIAKVAGGNVIRMLKETWAR